MDSAFDSGHVVISRHGEAKGTTTGAHYRCSMEGCTGHRVVVRWPDKRTTRPCSKGMLFNDEAKTWQII